MFTIDPIFHVISKIATTEKPYDELPVTLQKIFEYIKSGNPINDEFYYDWLREFDLTSPEEKAHYDNEKEYSIMSWLPSAIFKDGTSFEVTNIDRLTGLQYFDIDNLGSKENAVIMRQQLAQNPFILACWVSASGKGIGALIQVEGLTIENYLSRYSLIAHVVFNSQYDEKCSNPSRKNCLSYDKDIYINLSALPFPSPVECHLQNSFPKKQSGVIKVTKLKGTLKDEYLASSMTPTKNTYKEIEKACKHNWEDLMAGIKSTKFLLGNEITRDECDTNKFYAIYYAKRTFYPIFKLKQTKGFKIEIGQRVKYMFAICRNLMLNNEKLLLHSDISVLTPFFNFFKRINESFLSESLEERELLKIIASCYNYLQSGTLCSKFGKQKLIGWGQGNKYSTKEKQRIGAREGRKAVGKRTQEKIKEFINQYSAINFGEMPSKKKIMEATGIKSKTTIMKYWKDSKVIAPKIKSKITMKIIQRGTEKIHFIMGAPGEQLIVKRDSIIPNDENKQEFYTFEEVIKHSILLDDWTCTWNSELKAFYHKEMNSGKSFELVCSRIYQYLPFKKAS